MKDSVSRSISASAVFLFVVLSGQLLLSAGEEADKEAIVVSLAEARGQGQNLAVLESTLTITPENWEAVISAVATPKKEIMFTTFIGVNEAMLDINTNFFYWAHKAGAGDHLLLLSEDKKSCEMLWKAGVPCWVDNFCPKGDQLPPGQYQVAKNHWYCKFWWGSHFIKNGYTAMFMDNDNIVLKDPFLNYDPDAYDMEGLSDWVRSLDRPTPKEMLYSPCGYKEIKWPGGKGQFLASADADSDGSIAYAMTPCMSTGMWFVYPKPRTISLFDDLLEWLIVKHDPDQWEQAAFNEVVTAHMIDVRDNDVSLRFRLLPHSRYSNLVTYKDRLKANMTVDQVVVHPCCVGHAKKDALNEAGLWQVEQWQPAWGKEIVDQYIGCLENPFGETCMKEAPQEKLRHMRSRRYLGQHLTWRKDIAQALA